MFSLLCLLPLQLAWGGGGEQEQGLGKSKDDASTLVYLMKNIVFLHPCLAHSQLAFFLMLRSDASCQNTQDGRTDRETDRQTDRQTASQAGRQAGRQPGRQARKEASKQANKQNTQAHTHTHTHAHGSIPERVEFHSHRLFQTSMHKGCTNMKTTMTSVKHQTGAFAELAWH